MFLKKSAGFSLIEILLALTISISIIISSFFVYVKVKNEQNINRVVSQINQLREGARHLYTLERTYVNINDKTLISLDLAPKEMVNSNDHLINPYGGRITVNSSAANQDLRFNIVYYNIPISDCMKISSIINQSFWAVAIAAGGLDIKHDGSNIKFSVDKANQACHSQNTEHVNMVFQSS